MDQVEELSSGKSYVYYKTTCSCQGHDMTLEIEHDKDLKLLTMYVKVFGPAPYYYQDNPWYRNLWYRLKFAVILLFQNRIEYEESFIFRGEKHIGDLVKAIQEGLERVREREQ